MGIFALQPGLVVTSEQQIDITLKLGSGNRAAIEGTTSQNTLVFHVYALVFTGPGPKDRNL